MVTMSEQELQDQAWVQYLAQKLRSGESPEHIVREIKTYLHIWRNAKIR